MKELFIIFLAVILPGSMFAQTKTDPGKQKYIKGIYLDVSAGISFPIGKSYTKAEGNDPKSGCAGTGFLVQVNGEWVGNNVLGLGFQYDYQHNPILASAQELVLVGGDNTPLGSGAWKNHYLLVGPVFVKQVHNLLINAKVFAGLILSFSPVFRYIDPVSQQSTNGMTYGFGYGMGIGLGYSVSKRVSLMMNVNYLGGSPKLSKESQVITWDSTTNTNVTSMTEISIKKIVSTVNIGAGAVFKF